MTLQSSYFHPHFSSWETEPQRDWVTCPKPHGILRTTGFELRPTVEPRTLNTASVFADTLVVHMLIFGTQKKSPQGPEKTPPPPPTHGPRSFKMAGNSQSPWPLFPIHQPGQPGRTSCPRQCEPWKEASPCCRYSSSQAFPLHYYPPRERPATTSIICGWDHGQKQSTTIPVRLTCWLWAVGPDWNVRLVQRAPGPPLGSDWPKVPSANTAHLPLHPSGIPIFRIANTPGKRNPSAKPIFWGTGLDVYTSNVTSIFHYLGCVCLKSLSVVSINIQTVLPFLLPWVGILYLVSWEPFNLGRARLLDKEAMPKPSHGRIHKLHFFLLQKTL